MPDQEVREKILKEDWNSMIEADQVCIFEFVWKYFILMWICLKFFLPHLETFFLLLLSVNLSYKFFFTLRNIFKYEFANNISMNFLPHNFFQRNIIFSMWICSNYFFPAKTNIFSSNFKWKQATPSKASLKVLFSLLPLTNTMLVLPYLFPPNSKVQTTMIPLKSIVLQHGVIVFYI